MKTLLFSILLSLSALAFDPTVTLEYNVSKMAQSDILFIIDNSGSMGPHQQTLQALSNEFLNGLQGISYKITAISTDKDDALQNFVLDQNTTDPVTKLKQLIMSFGTSGSGTELPFQVITNFVNAGNDHLFFRPSSAREIIILTDEEEQSSQTVTDMENTFSKLNNVTVNTILPLSDSPACSPMVQRSNTKLEELTNKTGGMLLDLCKSNIAFQKDYASLSEAIAQRAFSGVNEVPVSSVTIKENIDVDSIKIFYGQQIIPRGLLHTGWIFDEVNNTILLGKNIKLSEQPAGTKFTIQYDIL